MSDNPKNTAVNWIHVKEAKPKEDQRVLVCWEPSFGFGIKEATFRGGEFYRDFGCAPYSRVTHWTVMPDHPCREDIEKQRMQELQRFLNSDYVVHPKHTDIINYRLNEVSAGDYVYIGFGNIKWATVDLVYGDIICAGGLTWKITKEEPMERAFGGALIFACWNDERGYTRSITSWVKAANMEKNE